MIERRGTEGTGAVEEEDRLPRFQGSRIEEEGLVLSKKERGAATGNEAFGLPLGALAETTEPAPVAVRDGLEEEDVDLDDVSDLKALQKARSHAVNDLLVDTGFGVAHHQVARRRGPRPCTRAGA
jgi:hypothetical protein